MTRRTVIGVVLLLGLVACASPSSQQAAMAPVKVPIPPASSPEALAAGARLAQQHCTRCHAEGGPDGQALPDLTGQAWTVHAWHHPDSVLVQMITDGVSRPTGTMPAFGAILRPDEIKTLIAFIKTFWTPEHLQLQQERTHRADVMVHRPQP
jgi:mono/diheme cytochrome c family protein